jgi:H2-forming N5,N10-methylenetetrahydromethanopterin dehydrogenase-like enzyme
MEMSTRDNGKMIKHTDKEVTNMLTGLHMLVSGKTINNMERVLKPGLMEPSMKEIILKEKNMEKEH